jgi:hypothetical protein
MYVGDLEDEMEEVLPMEGAGLRGDPGGSSPAHEKST